MLLKSTRLDLHSLKGGSTHPKNHPTPVGAGVLTRPPLSQHPPTKAAWIPTNVVQYSTPSTAVTQKGPRVVQTQAAENRRIPQSPSPEGYHNSTNPTLGCTAARNHFHWSTFSFSESRTAFSFALQKKKWFWPPLGKRKNDPQPGRQKPTAR